MKPSCITKDALPWRVPGVLAVTQVVHWGSLYYAFSVLASGMARDLDAPRAAVVGAFSVALLAQGATALLAGPLIDRIGARRAMTAGSLGAGIGLALASQAASLWQLYLAWALIGAMMAFTLYEAAFTAVTAAFGAAAARRGIAAVTLVGGLASTVSWPLVGVLEASEGWRTTLLLLALANAACALPHGLVLPGPVRAVARDTGEAADLRAVLRLPSFRWLCAALLAVAFLGASIAVHLVPMLQAKGLDAATALGIAALLGPMQVAGRVMEMTFGRRTPIRLVARIATVALMLALCSLAIGSGWIALALAVALYGAANGTLTIVRGAAPAEMVGARAYAAAMGVVAGGNALAAAGGPVMVAWIWSATGGPAAPLLLLAGVAGCAALGFAMAGRAPRGGG